MRLGAELDQLRQGAMAQAIAQSMREALDLHTWRYGMIANLLAAYHRAQSPEEKAAYAALLEPLAEAAQAPKERETVVPRVGVRIGYLPTTLVGQLLKKGVVQNQPQQQGQQGGAEQSNQPLPAEQPTTAPPTAATQQPTEKRKPTEEELQAIMEVLSLVDPWFALVRNRLRTAAQQTATPEQQPEGAVEPMQQQPVGEQGAEQPIFEEQTEGTVQPLQQQPVGQQGAEQLILEQQTETAAQSAAQQSVEQQPQGRLGGILQQQPNQLQPTMSTQPSPQQPQERKYEPIARWDWSGRNWWTDYSALTLPQGGLGEILQRQLPSEVYDMLDQMVEQWIRTNRHQRTSPEQSGAQRLPSLDTIPESEAGIWWARDNGPMVYIPQEVVSKINDQLLPLVFPWYHQLKDNPRVRESLSRILWQSR
jgi:hypothetical protein